jgi:hypothetical protein
VKDVFCTNGNLRFRIFLFSNESKINLTYDHYLLLANNEWIFAKYAEVGMEVRSSNNNQILKIISIEETIGILNSDIFLGGRGYYPSWKRTTKMITEMTEIV